MLHEKGIFLFCQFTGNRVTIKAELNKKVRVKTSKDILYDLETNKPV